ncbi:MAG: type III pantothenate kinase [Candidatus Omnitrophica bacterium]|nr:type III pantothenate kinase [Candidatus Omnitrophota bacterium]
MAEQFLFTLDIGNTNVTCGLFRGAQLSASWRLSTHGPKTVDESAVILRDLFDSARIRLSNVGAVILCSVVPSTLHTLKDSLVQIFPGVTPITVGETFTVPLPNRYALPEQVGQDRLVNAYAALQAAGSPALIVDFGTAITIDLVNAEGAYTGGVIAPGVEISLDALSQRTALLPRIELAAPPAVLGRDTVNSMRSGLLYGFASLCDGLVTRIREEQRLTACPVIATGGYATLIAEHCRTVTRVEPNLTLQGLQQLSIWWVKQASGKKIA